MNGKVIAIFVAAIAVLGIAGCTGTTGGSASSTGSTGGTGSMGGAGNAGQVLEITNGSITQDGVTVTMERASATPTTDVKGYDYSFDVTIQNDSDEGVMQLVYGIAILDADGAEIRSFGHVRDEETRALAPGETTSEHIDTRWGPAEPASVSLTKLTVVPESDMPAIHLPQKGEYLYLALGDEKLANIKEEPPVSLSFHIDQGGAGRTATFNSGEGLDKAVELLCGIKIGDGDAEMATDNYNWIYLTWADGSHSHISLTLRNLEFAGHKNKYHAYTLENLDPFWNYAAASASPDTDDVQDS